MVIECSFGRLKAWFGALKRCMDINLDELADVICACFVLPNFCELNNERINEECVTAAINYDREFQPTVVPNNYRTDANEIEDNNNNNKLYFYSVYINNCSRRFTILQNVVR